MNPNRKFRLTSFSVVVVAQNHNPTLLNPDFLEINGIVEEKRKVVEALTTPPVSIVRYEDGLSITFELQKLQILQPTPVTFADDWEAPKIAVNFVKALPHVLYKAVGLNWIGVLTHSDPSNWLKERFVNPGPWNNKKLPLQSVGISFTYPFDNENSCNLRLETGEVRDFSGTLESGIAVNANYHHDVKDEADAACKAIKRWKSRQKHLIRLLKIILDTDV